jgi:methionine--tRNA ligase beta chain
MPAFTAKVARQLNLPLSAFDLYFTELVIDANVLPVGHELGEVVPIFRRIEAAEVEALRLRYAGTQVHAAQNAQQSAAAAAAAGACMGMGEGQMMTYAMIVRVMTTQRFFKHCALYTTSRHTAKSSASTLIDSRLIVSFILLIPRTSGVAATASSASATDAASSRELIYSNAVEFPLDLQVGLVREAAPVPASDKLYVLQVEMGGGAVRQIVSGLQQHYAANELVGKRVVVVCNLKPVKFVGVPSNGMILTAVSAVAAAPTAAVASDASAAAADAAPAESAAAVAAAPAAVATTLGLLTVDASVAPGTKVAPKGSKTVLQNKFDLKKQMPLLPFAVESVVAPADAEAAAAAPSAVDAGVAHITFAGLALVAGGVAPVVAERVAGNVGAKVM